MSVEVQDIDHARRIARDYAAEAGVNAERAEAYADVWFDAGKDAEASTIDALRMYLRGRFLPAR